MTLKPIFDWGMFNWCLTPALIVGSSRHHTTGAWQASWVYVYWGRGRIGVNFKPAEPAQEAPRPPPAPAPAAPPKPKKRKPAAIAAKRKR